MLRLASLGIVALLGAGGTVSTVHADGGEGHHHQGASVVVRGSCNAVNSPHADVDCTSRGHTGTGRHGRHRHGVGLPGTGGGGGDSSSCTGTLALCPVVDLLPGEVITLDNLLGLARP